jgi:hypothetical protein
MSERDDVLEALPRATDDWMFGHGQKSNAFVFLREGRVWILPFTGGMLDAPVSAFEGDIAPFSD